VVKVEPGVVHKATPFNKLCLLQPWLLQRLGRIRGYTRFI